MIAIRDIIIFLAGAASLYVYYLTQHYFYGKRISVSNITQKEESHQPRVINLGLPSVDVGKFDSMLHEINSSDEFKQTNSRRLKERI